MFWKKIGLVHGLFQMSSVAKFKYQVKFSSKMNT